MAGLRDCSFLPHKTKRPPIELFPDMVRQAKVKAQAPSDFFADGRGARDQFPERCRSVTPSRPPWPAESWTSGVVRHGRCLRCGSLCGKGRLCQYGQGWHYGKNGTNWGNGLPFKATLATLQRGHERYQIQCAVCHGATGAGQWNRHQVWSWSAWPTFSSNA